MRKAKTEADALDAAGDKEGAKAARRAARERTAELKSWCEDKKRDFYPERVRVVKPGEAVERAKSAGGYSGAKKTDGWEDRHAERYYEEVRNRKPYVDAKKIAPQTRFTEDQVEDIRQHMFIRVHPLDQGTRLERFDADYHQSVAWQRLAEGKGTETDKLMLEHEHYELTIMRQFGYNYDEAHELTNQKYDWWAAVSKSARKGEK